METTKVTVIGFDSTGFTVLVKWSNVFGVTHTTEFRKVEHSMFNTISGSKHVEPVGELAKMIAKYC